MKKCYLLLLTALSIGVSFGQQPANTNASKFKNLPVLNSNSSNQTLQLNGLNNQPGNVGFGNHTCKTHELTEQYYQSIGQLNQFNSSYQHSTANVHVPNSMKTPGANTISVIFHVVHNPNNPAENVSNALIMQVFNDIQQDFQLLNADAANARTGFGFTPADANINFCLATQTAAGVPLSEVGVIRVSTTEDWYDSDNGEENKMKASATGGSQIWDRNKYLNVWICDISNGAGSGTAGYAYRPTTTFLPSASIDGIVLDYNLGVNNDNVLTHEIGHYLGLDHTWGGSGGCSNDDGFADTPNTTGPSFDYPGSCSGNQSTCSGIQTQYENYMDYSNCTVMFTQNQANYMLSILGGIRNSLLLSPGCDPVNAPPVANFTADVSSPIIIPVGGSLNFTDLSTNAPTGWSWNFGGGSAAQTVQNPIASFNTVGTYTVTLTATNVYGSDSEVKTSYVQVVAAASGTACDTLRNYNPVTEEEGIYLAEEGYIPGTAKFGGIGVTKWADKYVASASTQVRRLRFPIYGADNLSGNGMMKVRVKTDNSGSPAATALVTDTFLIADMNVNAYNEFDFTVPPTVTGTFWIEFELFYGTPQDTVILSLVDFPYRTAGINTMKLMYNNVWYTPSAIFGPGYNSSLWLDVLTSNGPAPVADFTYSEDTICVNGAVSVNGSMSTNTTNYFWYVTDDPVTTILQSSSTASNNFTINATGNKRIYLFADGSCKTDGLYLPIRVNVTPTATVTSTNTTCGNNNGSITVSGATGGISPFYSYSLDGVNFQTSAVFSNLPAGTYTVYIKTPGSNCDVTYSATINSSAPFVAGISPNTSICPSQSATITASGGTTYAWYDGSTLIGSTASITVSPANTTQYSCVVTDASSCQSTVYTTVTVTPLEDATFEFFDYCVTSTGLPSNVATAGGIFSFNPVPADGATINATTGEISNGVLSTSYTVVYSFGGSCPSSHTEVVTVTSSDDASFTATSWCSGSSNSISGIATSGGTFSFSPVPADGATIDPSTGLISNAVAGNTYTIVYTTPAGACQSSSSTSVTFNANPSVNAGSDQTVCDGTMVVLSGAGASTYSWNNSVVNSVAFAPTIGTTTYTVTGTDAYGCVNTDQVNVTVNALPTVSLGSLSTVCENWAAYALTGGTPAGGTYSGTGVTAGNFNPSTAGAGTHTITYTYVDGNGCSNTATSNLLVDDCLGVNELNENSVSVYPNPTTEILWVELSGEFNAELFDSRGRLVYSSKGVNKIEISTSNIETGVYMLKVKNNSFEQTHRIVKQ